MFLILNSCNQVVNDNQSRAEITAVLLHKSCTEPLSEFNCVWVKLLLKFSTINCKNTNMNNLTEFNFRSSLSLK
jgi:hypothetical protein